MQLFGSRRQKDGQSVDAGRLRRAAEAEASGMTCLKEGNLARAEAEFRRCVDLNPGGALGHGYLGLTLYRLGRLTDAASELSEAISLAPTDDVLQRTHGLILEALGQLDEAAEAYSKALELNPQSARSHAALGSLALKRGDLKAAEELVEKALAIDPQDTQALGELAEIRHRRGNLDGAIAVLSTALITHPNSVTFHFKLGQLMEESHKPAAAIAEFNKALEQQANDPEILFALGRVLLKSGRGYEVQPIYDRAMKALPSGQQRYEADLYRLLVEHSSSGQFEIPDAVPATQLSPKETRKQQAPAVIAKPGAASSGIADTLAAAIAALEAQIEREPTNSRLYRELSIQYLRAGRLSDAMAMVRQAEQLRSQGGARQVERA